MKKIFVFLILFAGCVEAKEDHIGLRFWGGYDRVVFSRPVAVVAGGLWVATVYQLQTNPEQYEGPGRFFAGDHANIGFVLYVSGYLLQNYFPDVWTRLATIRNLCRLGLWVELDDVVQHLIIQRRDDYGPGLAGQDYKIGWIQKAYRWSLENRRDNDRAKVMANLLSVGRASLSVGYFQGPAWQVIFGRAELMSWLSVSSVVLASYSYCLKTELAIEQVFCGPEVEARIYKNLHLTAFVGVRMLDKRAGANVERMAFGWGVNLK